MKKSAIIKIHSSDLETLKKNNYSLCFAKKVNGEYKVIWNASTKYLANNTFSWEPLYALFGSNTFQSSVKVSVATNNVNITLGQIATLDKSGEIGKPSSQSSEPESVILKNDYGPIHPGVNSTYTDLRGNVQTTPIYVAPDQIVSGQATLTPKDVVSVWFAQKVETSTMISEAGSNSVVIDLTHEDSQTRLYQNGKWTTPPPSESLFLGPVVFGIVTVIGVATAAAIASKIGAYLTGVYTGFTVEVSPGSGSKNFKVVFSERSEGEGANAQFVSYMSDAFKVDGLTEILIKSLYDLGLSFETLQLDGKP